ncbi:MAG: TIR domain-containing protein [Candidatus Tectomicrobia bacterium]|nr:TIR domain-containing protein [Candidatus Tectomicrobia bacterium]
MENRDTFSDIIARKLPEKFLVAFSFAGEQRDLVRAIAEAVEKKIGSNSVFFDEWFEYYIAGQDADLKLHEIYGERCELAVVCISERYGGKPWTQAEHEAIRARHAGFRSHPNLLHGRGRSVAVGSVLRSSGSR